MSNDTLEADGFETEVRDGMRISWDVPITMDDGNVLRADIYRPLEDGEYPVIMSHSPYGKALSMQDAYAYAWNKIVKGAPNVLEGSTNTYQAWEVVDPEKWVPDGYVCVRVDSRGGGRSPGYLDPFSPRETRDLYNCIEWAGTQPWSNGKVGLNGISYFAMNQWHVASLRPPHLAAICVWEGCSDHYRDCARHGGIMCDFIGNWYRRQVVSVQHGVGENSAVSTMNGRHISGDDTLPDEVRAENRADLPAEILKRPFDGPYYRERSANFDAIEVPLLSAANWGGMGLHPRGNFEGWARAASTQKWLEVHGDSHFTPFYRQSGEDMHKRFFGHFLKGEDTGWLDQPPVQLNIRHPGEKFVKRDEQEWPLARTEWTKFHLHPDPERLSTDAFQGETTLDYDTTGEGLMFTTGPLEREIEITGPVAARLSLSSQTEDADVFLALRLFDPDGKEVLFVGSNDPKVPIGLGWLRASQRKLNPDMSTPWRPWHSHDEAWPLTPGDPVALDVEILPTSIVVPVGYTLTLNLRGRDYEHDEPSDLPGSPYPVKGVGPFYHRNPADRPPEVFETTNTVHFGGGHENYLLLPIIPST